MKENSKELNYLESLNCIPRSSTGTSDSRRLRKTGQIPAVGYFSDSTSVSFYVSSHEILLLSKKGFFKSTPINLKLEDKVFVAIPKIVQKHPIKDNIIHIEFLIDNGEEKVFEVPLFYENLDKSPGFKKNAFFNITSRSIKIKGKITNLPKVIKKDISDIESGNLIYSTDIQLPEGYTLAQKKQVIANMIGKGGGSRDKAATESSDSAAAPAAKAPAKK